MKLIFGDVGKNRELTDLFIFFKKIKMSIVEKICLLIINVIL